MLENAKAELDKPFIHEDELKTKSARLAELNAMLDEAESQEGIPDEEAWDEEELALIEKYKPVLAEAV